MKDNAVKKADLKTRLLCSGVNLPESMRTGRKGGAGPAGGKYLVIEAMVVNAPVYGAALHSHFSVKRMNDAYYLENDEVHRVSIVKDPQWYNLKTEDEILYKKIALLHGRNCLATTVYQKCMHWRKDPCSFCGIELSLKSGGTIERKTPEQLREVAETAHNQGCTHVTLTTGTPNKTDRGALLLGRCAFALNHIRLPVHVQLEPVERKYMNGLRDSGADTIGIHIETLDSGLFRKICPFKDFSGFEKAWRTALEIFGDNQVSSYVLAGLGEDTDKMLSGIENMIEIGVIPYVVPFRPLPGTIMESSPFPPFELVKKYSLFAAEKMKEYGIDPFRNKAGCVRCGACSSVKEYIKAV